MSAHCTNQDQHTNVQQARRITKQPVAHGKVAEQRISEGTRYPTSRPQISAQCTNQDQQRNVQRARRITKQPVVHGKVAEQRISGGTRNPTLEPQISAQCTKQGQQRNVQQARRIPKQPVVHRIIAEQRNSVQAHVSAYYTNQDQQRKTKVMRKVAKPPAVRQQHAGQKTSYTASQRQVLQSTNQEQRRNTQHVMGSMPKSLLLRQQDVEQKSGGSEETMIRRQWYRRPGVAQRMRAAPIAEHGYVATSTTVPKEATSKEGAIRQNCKSQAGLVLTKHQGKNGHQAAPKHQSEARGDQMKPKANRVVTVNHMRPGRRVAIQQGDNDHDPSVRRDGLCKLTDPAQQELIFIRVLRKRF